MYRSSSHSCNFALCLLSFIGTLKFLYAKSVRTIYAYLIIGLLALPMEMSTQQPLTLCEYIILPFRNIPSVSVVATRSLSIFKFCENLIVRASFNNTLRPFMSETLRKSKVKVRKSIESSCGNNRFLLLCSSISVQERCFYVFTFCGA